MRIMMILLLLIGCSKYEKRCSKITSVGGCNRHGRCGVMYEDGGISTEKFPVVGMQDCYYIEPN